jgi:uncharacterized membrane protein
MRDGDFRIRGKEISRVEGLSDAVFGFAITLLVVSLEVPKTADEVLHAMRGFFAFAITFTLLFMVWRVQFTFFRRYGLEDTTTVVLNAMLLFVVLFFVYPLKYVFTSMMERVLTHAGFPDASAPNLLKDQHALVLLVIYALGWMAVFGVFALLHRHAYNKRDDLELTPVEEFDTRLSVSTHLFNALVGLMLAAANFTNYLLRTNKSGEWVSVATSSAILLAMASFFRWRRRARGKRRELIESFKTASVAVA